MSTERIRGSTRVIEQRAKVMEDLAGVLARIVAAAGEAVAKQQESRP